MRSFLLCLLVSLGSCLGPTPVTTGVVIGTDSWAYFDGDVLVGRGDLSIEAGIWMKGSGMPLLGPVIVPAGRVLVIRRSDGFRETYAVGEPIPYWAVFAFPGGSERAEELGITFYPPNP